MGTEIAAEIFYIGVSDRKSSLFEALWPIPQGVSYNSYLIRSEKIALIDICEKSFAEDYLSNIRAIIGTRKIDFLVINHMEPDHTGAIHDLLQAYPDLTIIGNAKTLDLLNAFYHLDLKTQEIKEGDELDLGTHRLRFYMTPMLHWPETMMSYETTTSTLFSGDVFGCFGALNGTPIDRDIDLSVYWPEVTRYYAAIIAKYATPVQTALKKMESLSINQLCTTHGPVWTTSIPKLFDLYRQYAHWQSSGGVVIAYASMYGHTSILAGKIAEMIANHGEKNIKIFDLSTTDISYPLAALMECKTLIIGTPVYNNSVFPKVETLMNAIKSREIKNRAYASFGTYAWSPAALKQLDNFGVEMNWEILAPTIRQKCTYTDELNTACQSLAEAVSK